MRGSGRAGYLHRKLSGTGERWYVTHSSMLLRTLSLTFNLKELQSLLCLPSFHEKVQLWSERERGRELLRGRRRTK